MPRSRIKGKITDPKGAIVIGAAVTVTDIDTNQTFAAVTDKQGQFKIEGLPPGTYPVTVSAQGFSESRRADVKVEEGAVTVTPGIKPNSDSCLSETARSRKGGGRFRRPFATVNNLVLKRDAGIFTLTSGEIYFARPLKIEPGNRRNAWYFARLTTCWR